MDIGFIIYGYILLNNAESIMGYIIMIAFIPDSLKSDVLAMIERFSFVDGEIEYVTTEV